MRYAAEKGKDRGREGRERKPEEKNLHEVFVLLLADRRRGLEIL